MTTSAAPRSCDCMPKRTRALSSSEEQPSKRRRTLSPSAALLSSQSHNPPCRLLYQTAKSDISTFPQEEQRQSSSSSPTGLGRWLEGIGENTLHYTAQGVVETQERFPLCEDALRILDSQNEPIYPEGMSGNASKTKDTGGTIDSSKSSEKADKGINAYHADFIEELGRRNFHRLEEDDEREPQNLAAFTTALRQERSSPEPSAEDREDVKDRFRRIFNQGAMLQAILPKLIQQDALWKDKRLALIPDQAWKRAACVPHPIGVGKALVCPQPDCTIGWAAREFPFFDALAAFRPHAAPLAGISGVAFPCIAVEGKGDKGSFEVSKMQNIYNGATMLWNMYQVRKCAGNDREFLDKIQVITLSVTTQSIELCYHWASEDRNGQLGFFSKIYDTWGAKSVSMAPYVEARRCSRNAIEWILQATRSWIDEDVKLVQDRIVGMARTRQQIIPLPSVKGKVVKRKLTDIGDDRQNGAKSQILSEFTEERGINPEVGKSDVGERSPLSESALRFFDSPKTIKNAEDMFCPYQQHERELNRSNGEQGDPGEGS